MPNLRTKPAKRKLTDYEDSMSSFETDDNFYSEKNYSIKDFEVLRNLNMSTNELLSLSVGELNKKMKNVSDSQVKQIKQLRRTLKNRGYAAICRGKRVEQMSKLEAEKKTLIKEINFLKHEKDGQVKIYNELVKQYNSMKKKLSKHKSKIQSSIQVVPGS